MAPEDTAVTYLDALEIFSKGNIDRVQQIIPYWMAAYNQQDSASDPLIASCTPLHLAVQCPRKDVISAILDFDHPRVPIDAVDSHKMTALHLAAKASRRDIVKLLLRRGANDMLQDANGQDPLAYATEPDVAALIQDHRSELAHAVTTQLFALARSGNSEAVHDMISDEKLSRRINLAARDSDGGTVLHEAVQNNMLELARWAITEGVDVFARDAHGKMAEKYAEDHQMRELLQQAPMGNARALPSDKAPKLNGELHKWTNYAGGWKSRWFELEDGVLSYYKNKADAESSCRGAINLRIAKIMMGKDKAQFEVHGKGSIKYRLKANDPAIAKQWVHLLNVSKQWATERLKRQQNEDEEESHAASVKQQSVAAESEASTADAGQGRARTSSLLRPKASETASVRTAPHHMRGASGSSLSLEGTTGYVSGPTGLTVPPSDVSSLSHSPRPERLSPGQTEISNQTGSDADSPAASIMSSESDDELYNSRDTFLSAVADLRSQLFIQDRLLEGLAKRRGASDAPVSAEDIAKYHSIATQTTAQSRELITMLDKVYRETTAAWRARLRREQERIDMLADSLRNAVVSSQTLLESMRQQQKDNAGLQAQQPEQATETKESGNAPTPAALAAASTCMSDYGISMGMRNLSVDGTTPESGSSLEDEEEEFADATDEFFDAATSAVSLTASGAPSSTASLRRSTTVDLTGEEPEPEKPLAPTKPPVSDITALSGYSVPTRIRTKLPEILRGGPSLNLWSIIKGAIGKDLSKVSVPVFFNEPTSFLQRFTEDMEYCDLLEIATLLPRSEDRTLFVAGFAMSNYASTFGRIAKPFNPLLGETFEYVRRDKRYRALSEQVEHHPPISACWVEGTNYVYHADTNIKSKFNSGSLTVVPTGVCHVELKLPLAFLERSEEKNAGEPLQKPHINEEEGYFVEHYTWNKLTTNVNGIIIANFWIEHVGDLDVVNHRTGDRTKITFLPSGWTGKNKFKVTGEALDRHGKKIYEIGGDWTSKLVAKPVGTKIPDHDAESISCPTPSDANAVNAGDAVKYAASNSIEVPRKPFVLWRINDRPETNNTYHLTRFAMSLNDRPAELEPFLCPTDSRFRPDQRAMETGEYELADQEKSRLENKQRATRRRREQGELEPWKPRWFVKDVDEDSGEPYWRFNGEYWAERERVAGLKKQEGQQPAPIEMWNNVGDIF
ncbi:hypothetical protein LPJ78_005359 [Coemansia sp. RSA 989]|nr:hypothetical protein LPJ68_005131 [Coemansia sp. RSA 1086]KAJ1747380.1 hypothetical protein LPJ79_005293 [Coemansia sp. RSA 1821]KAJ1861386.1 hypothetical protein LPJ78_005359 [Coemansia sp. RSA 989]